MKNPVCDFEISVTDLERAIASYTERSEQSGILRYERAAADADGLRRKPKEAADHYE